MTNDDVQPIHLKVSGPLEKVPRPTTIDLPSGPDRPVNIHIEIDDERGCRVQYDIDLTAASADHIDRLASALLRGVHDVGSAYLAATWSGTPYDDHATAEGWRATVAERAAQL